MLKEPDSVDRDNNQEVSQMKLDSRFTLGISKGREFSRTTARFINKKVPADRTYIPKSITTRLSFFERIKNLLKSGFNGNGVALRRPSTYEIEILPILVGKRRSHSPQIDAPENMTAAQSAPGKTEAPARLRAAPQFTNGKRSDISSNLG